LGSSKQPIRSLSVQGIFFITFSKVQMGILLLPDPKLSPQL
jgi:hypothetical protein